MTDVLSEESNFYKEMRKQILRCQNGISKEKNMDGRGGRRYMPYAFTEQGISMLSAILKTDVAINVSIGIMRAFVEMRKFLATNSLILNRVDELEVKQLEYQRSTDERFDKVFKYIENHAESEQKIFLTRDNYSRKVRIGKKKIPSHDSPFSPHSSGQGRSSPSTALTKFKGRSAIRRS